MIAEKLKSKSNSANEINSSKNISDNIKKS